MNLSRKEVQSLLLAVLFTVITFGCGYWFGNSTDISAISLKRSLFPVGSRSAQSENRDLSLFWQVWDLLDKQYLYQEDLDSQKMVYGAISGLVDSISDPYTAFLDPKQNEIVKDGLNGRYEGIGAELGMREGKLLIIAPLEGSPAKQSGIKAGDWILTIDGDSSQDISLSQAVSRIRGEAGTKVELLVSREMEGNRKQIPIEVTRAEIELRSVQWSWSENVRDVAYIRLSRFGNTTTEEWENAVQEIKDSDHLAGIILDLRNNPGGVMSAAVDVASDFVPAGELIVSEHLKTGEERGFRSTGSPSFGSPTPLIILVNQGSASSSEILAGALKYYTDAVVVGKNTFGKGTVQDVHDFKDGSGVHITVAKWLLPDGTCVEEEGIEPDYDVSLDEETAKDIQLEKAEELLR
ncbi:MAG: S41 family peptidase [Patescibacteria group bacterium]